MKRSIQLAAVFCSLALAPALAGARLSNPSDSSTVFRTTGPAGMRIKGRGDKMTVADDGKNVVITVPLAQMTTGNDLRDKHMREKYLETDKYPDAELTVARWALRVPEDGTRVVAWAPGTLKLHGKSKEVKVVYKAKRSGNSYAVEATTDINVTDFGIETPSFLSVSVKPEVDIEVNFTVQDL
jgi:polyisoprenoid-binding protein YceI